MILLSFALVVWITIVHSSYSSHGQKIQTQQDRDRASVGGRSNKLTRRIEDMGISSRFVGRFSEVTRLKSKSMRRAFHHLSWDGVASLHGWNLNSTRKAFYHVSWDGVTSLHGESRRREFHCVSSDGYTKRGISSCVEGRCNMLARLSFRIKEKGIASCTEDGVTSLHGCHSE